MASLEIGPGEARRPRQSCSISGAGGGGALTLGAQPWGGGLATHRTLLAQGLPSGQSLQEGLGLWHQVL